MTLKRSLIALGLLVVLGLASWYFGPKMYRRALMNAWIHHNEYDIRRDGDLRVGDAAPDLELLRVGGGTARLSDYWATKPLVLIFGSYT